MFITQGLFMFFLYIFLLIAIMLFYLQAYVQSLVSLTLKCKLLLLVLTFHVYHAQEGLLLGLMRDLSRQLCIPLNLKCANIWLCLWTTFCLLSVISLLSHTPSPCDVYKTFFVPMFMQCYVFCCLYSKLTVNIFW